MTYSAQKRMERGLTFTRIFGSTPNDITHEFSEPFSIRLERGGFSKEAAEILMHGMTRSAGADLADTDCSRVLRLPGFANQKLDLHSIIRENLHQRVLRPEDSPRFELAELITPRAETNRIARSKGGLDRSQSAKDYRFARRALESSQN